VVQRSEFGGNAVWATSGKLLLKTELLVERAVLFATEIPKGEVYEI